MEAKDINLPDSVGEGAVPTFVGTDRVLFVEFHLDENPENPCSEDGFGMIRSLKWRHVNSISYPELQHTLETDFDAVPLSYFEHGMCRWGVQGSLSDTPDFQWDGVDLGGVWIPDAQLRKDADSDAHVGPGPSSRRREWMRQRAEEACETYTHWSNGSVYGFGVELFDVQRGESGIRCILRGCYDESPPIADSSSFGFFGWDSVCEAAREAALDLLASKEVT